MPTAIDSGPRANLFGSLWMVAAMGLFAVEDAFLKAAAGVLPVAQTLILFGAGGAVVFAALALRRGEALFHRDVLAPAMRVRVVFEVTGRLFYLLAIALIPLSTATVILQAAPLAVIVGAVFVFGERVGWRRWTAIFVGFAGVVLIVGPGSDAFSPLSLLAVLGMLGFAGRDLASRAAPATLGTLVLGLYGFLSIVLAGLIYAPFEGAAFVWPDRDSGLAVLAGTAAGVGAYACLMRAMRTGDVSAVTPFRYSRLLFGVLLGVLIFGEEIGVQTWMGSALIVLSGLFILRRS